MCWPCGTTLFGSGWNGHFRENIVIKCFQPRPPRRQRPDVFIGDDSTNCIFIPSVYVKAFHITITNLVDHFAVVRLFSDLVMEVRAGRSHSSPKHRGHLYLKRKARFKVCCVTHATIFSQHLPLMQTVCHPPAATELMCMPQRASTVLGSSSEMSSPCPNWPWL